MRGRRWRSTIPSRASSWPCSRWRRRYAPDRALECKEVFRTNDPAHPGVAAVMAQGEVNVAGPVQVLSEGPYPARYPGLYLRPAETRRLFQEKGWRTVAALQLRNPMHRSHEYLAKIAIEVCDGVLIQQILGKLKPGDVPAEVRVRAVDALVQGYFVPGTCRAGRRAPRDALRRAAGGAAARGVPPELRLQPPDRRARPRRGRRVLRPVRLPEDLRRDPARRARAPAAQDRLDVLLPPLRRHGVGAHLPPRGRGPHRRQRDAAAQDARPRAARSARTSAGPRCWRS